MVIETVIIPESASCIGFCTDIHSAMGNVLKMRQHRPDVEHWFCAGDVVDMDKPIHDNQPMLRMMARMDIPSVLGNHDFRVKQREGSRLDEEARSYLETMPFSMTLEFAGRPIQIFHATPRSIDDFISEQAGEATYMSLFEEHDADAFILGHTHAPYLKRFQGIEFINPGALGVPGFKPSFCVLDKEVRLLTRLA